MNAYELAEILEKNQFLNPNATKEATNMLRQQADRIAELEKELADLLEELRFSYDGQ